MTDDIHIRRVRQLVAPVLTGPGGLLDDLDDLHTAARMLDLFDDAGTGLSRSELLGSLRTGHPLSDHALELLFDKLCELEWLVQVRGKAGTQRWRPCALALTSVELLLSLSERSAADRLVELIVLALDRLDDPDLTQDGAADITRQLTRNVNLVAADLEAALVHGTLPAMQAAMPSARALTHVSRVSQLVQVARPRFPALKGELLAASEAVSRFRDAAHGIGAALTELVRSGEVDSAFAVLSPEAVLTACDRAVDQLARVAATAPFPRLPVVLDPVEVAEAAAELGVVRTPMRPPVPEPDDAVDPSRLMAQAQQRHLAEAERHRHWAEQATAGQPAALLDTDVWPTPLERLVDGLAVSTDTSIPVVMEVQQHQEVAPHPTTALTAPLRLRRLDDDQATQAQDPATSVQHPGPQVERSVGQGREERP